MSTTAEPGPILSEVRFRRAHRCFGARRRLTFQAGVNLIVGDQGAGKSTLVRLLREAGGDLPNARARAREVVELTVQRAGPMFVCDFERDNLRTLSGFVDGAMEAQIASIFSSHGEASLPLVEHLLAGPEAAGALVILDEPDTALSPRSARRLAALLDAHAAGGGQSICAVHNPIVIASQPKVLSLEHRRWMDSGAFLASHEEPAS